MVLPLVASADEINITTPDSCKMKRTIKISDTFTCSENKTYSIDSDESICCVMNTIYNFTDWAFVLLVGIAVIFIVIGAMQIIIGGRKGDIGAGRNYIVYAAIGLFVAFIARAIPGLIVRIIQ